MASTSFGQNPFSGSAAVSAAPVTSLQVEYRIVGDYWTFAVSFLNLNDGTPAAMAGMTPHADILVGYSFQPIALTALPPVTGDAANLIRFGIDTNTANPGGVTIIPQSQLAPTIGLRLRTYLIDGWGEAQATQSPSSLPAIREPSTSTFFPSLRLSSLRQGRRVRRVWQASRRACRRSRTS